MENFNYAFFLTFIAGLSTVVGGSFVFIFKRINGKFLSFGLGLSAGVMIYLSIFELLKEANKEIQLALGHNSNWYVIIFFVSGLVIAAILDMITIHQAKICENLDFNNGNQKFGGKSNCLIYRSHKSQKLLKTGLFVAFAIALHNFPEGMITFTTASFNYALGLSVAVAVAIHNIPEGFCVSLPIYYATKSKSKSIFYALLAGLAEPVGALVVYFFLNAYLSSMAISIMLGVVAGIMIYISLDELLPTANRFARWHISTSGLAFGMAIMAFGLYILK